MTQCSKTISDRRDEINMDKADAEEFADYIKDQIAEMGFEHYDRYCFQVDRKTMNTWLCGCHAQYIKRSVRASKNCLESWIRSGLLHDVYVVDKYPWSKDDSRRARGYMLNAHYRNDPDYELAVYLIRTDKKGELSWAAE